MSDLMQTRRSLFYLAAYLFPLSIGLLASPRATFHLLGSNAEHATTLWRLVGGLLFVLAVVVVVLILKHRAVSYVNTAIVRLVFIGLFSYLVGRTANPAYIVILSVLGVGELWTLIALALDLRTVLVPR